MGPALSACVSHDEAVKESAFQSCRHHDIGSDKFNACTRGITQEAALARAEDLEDFETKLDKCDERQAVAAARGVDADEVGCFGIE